MKILILIIAHDDGYYIDMQKLWRIYMNRFDNIKSFFIKYNNNIDSDILVQNDTIYVKGNDSYIPGCLDKTIKSLEYTLNEDFGFDFDYLIRTNLSSVWDFTKLNHFLESNSELVVGGVLGTAHNNIKFISGTGILLHKEVCKNIIQHKNLLDYNIIDDVALGIFLTQLLNNYKPLNRFEAYHYNNNINSVNKELLRPFIYSRCQCHNSTQTLQLMEHIINIIYS